MNGNNCGHNGYMLIQNGEKILAVCNDYGSVFEIHYYPIFQNITHYDDFLLNRIRLDYITGIRVSSNTFKFILYTDDTNHLN